MYSSLLVPLLLILIQLETFGTSAFQHPTLHVSSASSHKRIRADHLRPTTCLWQTKSNRTQRRTSWHEKYQELVEFRTKHGHLNVGKSTKLYHWIHYQRRKYARKEGVPSMTEEQIRLLDEIGFSWEPRGGPRSKAWDAKYQELADFYKKHGHLKVDYHGSLYTWICTQRRKRSNAKNFASLTDDQIRLLDEINFDWTPTGGPRDVAWHSKYQQLAEFHKKNGHLKVEGKRSLVHWKVTQRRRQTGMKGYSPLSDEQVQMLDDIDFQWADRQMAWNIRYQELAQFYKQHGHLNVEIGSSLFQWKLTQRRKRTGMKGYLPLTEEQIQLLGAIGFS